MKAMAPVVSVSVAVPTDVVPLTVVDALSVMVNVVMLASEVMPIAPAAPPLTMRL